MLNIGSTKVQRSFLGQITVVTHLFIPNGMRFILAQVETFFKNLERYLFDGAQRTISSAKRPPQQ